MSADRFYLEHWKVNEFFSPLSLVTHLRIDARKILEIDDFHRGPICEEAPPFVFRAGWIWPPLWEATWREHDLTSAGQIWKISQPRKSTTFGTYQPCLVFPCLFCLCHNFLVGSLPVKTCEPYLANPRSFWQELHWSAKDMGILQRILLDLLGDVWWDFETSHGCPIKMPSS